MPQPDSQRLETAGPLHVRLRERLKLRYMGDCKCGHCALVPDALVAEAADLSELMLAALKMVARDPLDVVLAKHVRAAIAKAEGRTS